MKNNYSFCSLLRFLPLSNTVSLSITLLVALLPFAFPLHSYADVDYLCFTAVEAGATIRVRSAGTNVSLTPTLYYSTDNGTTWSGPLSLNTNNNNPTTVCTLANIGDKVMFRGKNTTSNGIGSRMFSSTFYYWYFEVLDHKVNLGGDVMTLLDWENEITDMPCDYCFVNLFKSCSNIVSAEDFKISATNLTKGCCEKMFTNCSGMVTPPSVLAPTTLAQYCYNEMFNSCSALTTTPSLPASTLVSYCYNNMFRSCTHLTSVQGLPATTLASYCYSNMFNGCTSLTTAPELPATNLATYCYNYMFSGCYSLTTAPELPATTLAKNCYTGMFNNCTTLVNVPEKLPAIELPTGCYNLMFNKCSTLVNAPEIMATTINYNSSETGCMNQMFMSCPALRKVEVHFTAWDTHTVNTYYPTYQWLSGTYNNSACKFICPCGLANTRDDNRIRQYWTRSDIHTYIFNVETASGTWSDSGTNEIRSDERIAGLKSLTALPTAQKSDYTFIGWNTAADGSGTTLTIENQIDFTCTNTFYALFAPQLTFNVNGGSWDLEGSDTDPRVVTAPVVSLTDPQRTSYNFIGWNTQPNGSGSDFDIDNQPSAPTTYYAQWEFAAIDLADNIDNTTLLSGHIGDVVTVTLAGRTLVGNTTNTICLPFSMTAEQIDDSPLAGSTIWQFNSASCADETLTVSVSETSTITAGNPYLIVPVADIVEPTFVNVTISTTSGNSIGNGEVSFQGIQVPTPLTAGNQNQLFLTAGNILQHPSTNGNLKAYRAYFLLSEGTPASVMPRARVAFNRGPQMPTDIPSSIITDKPVKLIQDGQLLILRSGKTYTAQGQILIDN